MSAMSLPLTANTEVIGIVRKWHPKQKKISNPLKEKKKVKYWQVVQSKFQQEIRYKIGCWFSFYSDGK